MRDEPPETHPKQVKQILRRSELPALAAEGFIEWDSETQTVRRGPNFDEVAPIIEELLEREGSLPDDRLS